MHRLGCLALIRVNQSDHNFPPACPRAAGRTARFGEGDTANLSTSVSMDDRTFRFYRERQKDMCAFLTDLVFQAYKRQRQVTGQPLAVEYKHQNISAGTSGDGDVILCTSPSGFR